VAGNRHYSGSLAGSAKNNVNGTGIMRKLLVTGGAGFIGTNFVYYWLKKYPKDHIIVLDALTYAGNRQSLMAIDSNAHFNFIHGNILDENLVETLLIKHEINTIVHFAAESHVDRSILGPDEFINTNIIGTHSLLKAAKKIWIDSEISNHRFHHISTDEVYGTLNSGDPSFSEITRYAPNSPYAASKASSDHLVRAYHETYGLKTTISNCSNNYGPYQFPEKLIPLIIANILDNKPLPIYGDGRQIRDWLYVEDHNFGIDLILQKGKPGETYNIGGNNEWENIDIVRCICNLIDQQFADHLDLKKKYPDSPASKNKKAKTLITHVQDRAGHDRRYAVNAEKINTELGFSPQETFETGIQKTIHWFLNNENWWRSIMDKSYLKWIASNYS
jgi:dTDP-glucose 4,6-dehydratase